MPRQSSPAPNEPPQIVPSRSALLEARELYETTQEICSRLDLDEVLQAIVRRANRMLGGDVAYLATCDDANQVLRMRAFDKVRTAAFKSLVVPYDIGLGGAVAAQRRPMTTAEYSSDRALTHRTDIDDASRKEGLVAAVGAPVQFESKLLAVLFVSARRPHHFTDHQLTLLASLANAAAIAINNAQIHGRLVTAMTIHTALMDLALAGKGSQAVLDRLGELIQGPAAVVDWRGRFLYETADVGDTFTRVGTTSTPRDGVDPPAPAVTVDIPIHVGEIVEARLLAVPGIDDSDLGRLATEQAVAVFAMELAKARSADEAELRVRGGFLNDLLAQPVGDEAGLVRRAEQLGFDLQTSHVSALIGFRAPTAGIPAGQVWQRVLQVTTAVCQIAERGGLVVDRGTTVAVFFPADEVAAATDLLARVPVHCKRAHLPDVVIGVGAVTHAVTDYAVSLAEATRALEAAQRLVNLGSVVAYRDLGFHQFALGARPSAELIGEARKTLAPLLDYDARRSGDLLTTIKVFLGCNGNAEATARQLGLHPNSLRGRLSRITDLLGRDLGDPVTRLDLHLATQAIALAQSPSP